MTLDSAGLTDTGDLPGTDAGRSKTTPEGEAHPEALSEGGSEHEPAQGGNTESPTDGADPMAGSAGESGGVSASVDHADQANLANTIYQYQQNLLVSDFTVERITRRHFMELRMEELACVADESILDNSVLTDLTDCLTTHNILILSGRNELGKGTTARLAAWALGQHNGCKAKKVLVTSAPKRDLRIDFQDILCASREYQNLFLIIEHAFSRQNQDALRFIANLDSAYARQASQKMKQRSLYLIVTTNTDMLEKHRPATGFSGVYREAPLPQRQNLQTFLAQRIEMCRSSLRQGAPTAFSENAHSLFDDTLELLLDRLETFPRVDRFVDEYLLAIIQNQVTVEDALNRMDSQERWFTEELIRDFEKWSLALSLTLASSSPAEAAVPWIHFQKFHDQITASLRHTLKRADRDRSPTTLVMGQPALRQIRAQFVEQPLPAGASISFSDLALPEALWNVLLGSGKPLLGALVEKLQSLATGSPLFYVRHLAARALGKMGILEALPLFVWNLRSWRCSVCRCKTQPCTRQFLAWRGPGRWFGWT